MIKFVQQRQLPQPSTPVSSAQGKENIGATANSSEMMRKTANSVDGLKNNTRLGAGGKVSASTSPPNQNLADRTERVADNSI